MFWFNKNSFFSADLGNVRNNEKDGRCITNTTANRRKTASIEQYSSAG